MGSKFWFLTLVLSAGALRSDACGMFAGRGFQDLTALPVSIREEETLIVWDAAAQRQDFIRKVTFNAAVPQFGLLVPVPGRPEVAEASPKLFDELRGEMEDQRPQRTEYIWWPQPQNFGQADGAVGGGGGPPGSKGSRGGVHVIEEAQIGLFKAQVLTSTDAASLQAWLEEQGFSMGPGASAYLAHYTGGDWHWVALSYSGPGPGEGAQDGTIENIASQTFRLSFATPEAFYPYREPQLPEGMPPPPVTDPSPRTLRLYVLSSEPVTGRVREASGQESVWPRRAYGPNEGALFRAPLRHRAKSLAPLLPALPTTPTLSAFTESLYPGLVDQPEFSRRPDGDLYLRFDAALGELLLEEEVTTVDLSSWVILALLASVLGVVGWGGWHLVARLRRKT
jgi:hypothetical protein